ncbi:transposase-like protein [Paraburkholderia youngii]
MESIEILTERRAPQSARGAGKNRHVRETLELGASVSAVVHRHGVNANQLFGCRKQCQEGSLAAESAGEALCPASELVAVEQRLGTTQATQPSNGCRSMAWPIDHRTRSLARQLGLEPLSTLLRSPQSKWHDRIVREGYEARLRRFVGQALTRNRRSRVWLSRLNATKRRRTKP